MTVDIKPKKGDQPQGYAYKYKRLYDLGSDRLGIIESMLTNGESPQKVAEHIQGDWQECTNVKLATLVKQIQRYRADVLEPKIQMAAEKAAEKGTAISTQMKKFREQVSVMDELTKTLNMQMHRIQKAFTKEENKGEDGKLDPAINKELRAFTDIARALATLQLETGVLRRVPKQVQGIFAQLPAEELREFRLEMEQNDNSLRALNDIKDVLQEAAGDIIDGELVPASSESDSVPVGNDEDLEAKPH